MPLLEITRYIVSGAVAFLVDFIIFYALINIFDVHYLLANIVGYASGFLVVYMLNIKWVFFTKRFNHVGLQFGIFLAIAAFGLVLSEFVIWYFIDLLAVSAELSKIFSAGIVFVFNFTLRKLILFSHWKI